MLRLILILFVALALSAYSCRELVTINQNAWQADENSEALYLPNRAAVRAMSAGYANMLADVLWFKTISYFGKHHRSDRRYVWFDHMCNLVVDLNPAARHVYEFCALMLAWEARQPAESTAMLDRGIAQDPGYWKFPYLRGMNFMLFLEQPERATQDFITASKLPDAPVTIARIAAKKLAMHADPNEAISFLAEAVRNARSDLERQALLQRLREIQAEKARKQSAP